MPFFSDDEWMGHVDRFWIWLVLSLPSTAACFLFYRIWRRRAQRPTGGINDDEICLERQSSGHTS